jgi:paraquat-inducible protein B
MDISSPFFIVPLIAAIFIAAILFATGSKEDGHSAH